MSGGSAAECAVTYDAPDVELERKGRKTILRLKAIPWARVIVDTLLVAGIVLASSSFLSVR
jgi:hypothetical protein